MSTIMLNRIYGTSSEKTECLSFFFVNVPPTVYCFMVTDVIYPFVSLRQDTIKLILDGEREKQKVVPNSTNVESFILHLVFWS